MTKFSQIITLLFGNNEVEGNANNASKKSLPFTSDKSSDTNSKKEISSNRFVPTSGSGLKRNSSYRCSNKDKVDIEEAYKTMIQSGDVNLLRFAKALAGMQSFAIKSHFSFKLIHNDSEIQKELNNQFQQYATFSYLTDTKHRVKIDNTY